MNLSAKMQQIMDTRKVATLSEKNVDLQEVFKIPKLIMEIFGLWLHYHKGLLKKILQVVSIAIVLMFCSSMVAECIYVAKDFTSFLEVLTVLTSVSSFLFKQLVFSMNESKFLDICEMLDDKIFTNVPKPLKHMIEQLIRQAGTIGTLYMICAALAIILFISLPLTTKKALPIDITVLELGMFHWTVFLLQSLSLWIAAANNSSIDLAFVGAVCAINGHLQILKEKIRSFGKQETLISNEDVLSYLSKCAEHHMKIIELVEKVEKMFSTILLIQYLSSIMEICNTGFQLVIVEVFSFSFFMMIFYFTTMMFELGLYCWFGNEIILNSSAIKEACYESEWINYNTSVKKILIIIVERSKRPMYLTVGNFSVLSLKSFNSIINSAYSFFTLMQRMSQPPENRFN